jgi:hypothetical protein
MSWVLCGDGHGPQRRHWLAGVGGFELSDPEKPPLIGAPYSLQSGPNELDWGASHSLAAQPGKVSDRQTFRNEVKFGPHFKGQFWKRICEFESSHPNQPVRSLRCNIRACENRRYSRALGWRAGVSGRQILECQVRTGGFAAPVSARHFPNFRFGMRETGSMHVTIFSASRILGASAYMPANTSRSLLEKAKRSGDLRRSTFSWWRSTRSSALSAARDRNSPAKAHHISLQRSIIARERTSTGVMRGEGFSDLTGT